MKRSSQKKARKVNKFLQYVRRWGNTFWVKTAAVLAAIALALRLGPLFDIWSNTIPSVELVNKSNEYPDPFIIKNQSSIFAMHNYTPDCLVTFALWNMNGNIMAFWTEHNPPVMRDFSLRPGGVSNFACDLKSIMGIPVSNPGYDVNIKLLEVKLQIEIRYKTNFGFITFNRTHLSQSFCGSRKDSEFQWSVGDTILLNNEFSKKIIMDSLNSGNIANCISFEELKEILTAEGIHVTEGSYKAKSGKQTIRFPTNGPFRK